MYYFLKCTPHIKLFIFLFTVHMCGSHFCVFLQHYVVGFSLLSGARWWVVGGAVGDGRRVGWLGGAGLSGLHASVERTSKCCCSIESIKLPTITLKSRASISWSQQLVDCEWIGVKEMRRPNKNVQLNEKLSTWPSASANRRKIFEINLRFLWWLSKKCHYWQAHITTSQSNSFLYLFSMLLPLGFHSNTKCGCTQIIFGYLKTR